MVGLNAARRVFLRSWYASGSTLFMKTRTKSLVASPSFTVVASISWQQFADRAVTLLRWITLPVSSCPKCRCPIDDVQTSLVLTLYRVFFFKWLFHGCNETRPGASSLLANEWNEPVSSTFRRQLRIHGGISSAERTTGHFGRRLPDRVWIFDESNDSNTSGPR